MKSNNKNSIMTNKMNEELNRELKIVPPQGYEIDKENSTFERIVFKKKNNIKTWEDLCKSGKNIKGFFLSTASSNIIEATPTKANRYNRYIFLTEKQAKSARAAAIISQIMPYYGGVLTRKEWGNEDSLKFVIFREGNKVRRCCVYKTYNLLAFETEEQRDDFYNHNEQLVKEYLMID